MGRYETELEKARSALCYVTSEVFGANHGSYIGHPQLGTPGAKPTATAVGLNGLNQYVLLPRLITDDFSLELWLSSRGVRKNGHDRNEALVRKAYEAYGRGDIAAAMELADPELE